MVRLDVITTDEPCCSALDALKAYAAVSDPGQELLLSMALKRAFSEVQRYADVALLPGRYRVTAEDHPGIVKVYMGGKAVSAKDSLGLPVRYEQRGCKVYVGTDGVVEVEFITEVNEADYERLLPVVLRYATAVYDGKSRGELSQILKEC